jgi:subtilase family serine protease
MKGYFMAFVLVFVLTLGIGFTGQAYGQPDLIVSELLVQSDAGAGFKISITDVTRNKGGTATLSASMTYYYIKAAGYPGRILLGRRYVPELASHTANMGGNYLSIPSKDALTGKGWPVPGNYYIVAVADALKYITESSETNNQRRASIYILDPTAPPSSVCGDDVCNGTESCTSCPIDCCP